MSVPERDAVDAALAELRGREGVEYADARAVVQQGEQLKLRFEAVERLESQASRGIGVRVLFRGAWGFGARPGTTAAAAAQAARDALEVARASASVARRKVTLCEEEPAVGVWSTPVAIDPFAVPWDRKLGELQAAVAAARGAASAADAARIRSIEAHMLWQRERSWFGSTEGGRTEQTRTYGGAGLKVVAADGDESSVRTWPMDFDGGVLGCGYEAIGQLALVREAARVTGEALALLAAPVCPAGRTTLVLDTPQLALQIHESCGHPTESDRALGEEVSLAGASFLTPDRLGRFRYGAPRVNLVADATTPGGLGTFGWDDEGVPARRTPLVSRGVFVGYLSSRETAARLSLGRSAGCMRAESWNRPPIIRMVNVSLEPDPHGPSSLDELIADTDDGLLMTTNRSWSIDDLRLNFQFGCEAAWEIRRGKLGRLYRQPIYTGSTPRFWAGCDAIGGPAAWRTWGFVTCGKGDPMQLMAVGHGTAPARFRDVEVGSSGRGA
ncbi:MAG: TldD/PmbA family protein [Myxococcales bacterium]|nr:TldD/PmbA family protein [Myxococcales bacterium]